MKCFFIKIIDVIISIIVINLILFKLCINIICLFLILLQNSFDDAYMYLINIKSFLCKVINIKETKNIFLNSEYVKTLLTNNNDKMSN